jgi:hypothetical protein
MPKKQLRTVKKSSATGRLSRDAVRSAVISVRDANPSQARTSGGGRDQTGRGPGASNGSGKS